jgi:hypothetical protein
LKPLNSRSWASHDDNTESACPLLLTTFFFFSMSKIFILLQNGMGSLWRIFM